MPVTALKRTAPTRLRLLIVLATVSALHAQTPDPATLSTKQMSARLAAIYAATDWRGDPNKPQQRADYYKAKLAEPHTTADKLQLQLQMAIELLQAGKSAQAVDTIAAMRSLIDSTHITVPADFDLRLRKTAAMSFLRLGEQENCAHMQGGRACIFPIRGSGVHMLPRGAEGAVREFTQILERNQNDYQSQWLLNVAYMQLGKYPQDVPKRWLAPESLFHSDTNLGEFDEVATSAGLAVMGHSGGVVMEDFEGHGLLDIVTTSSGPLDQMHFFHNNGDGTFTDRTREAGLLGETGGLNLIATDYDNDGHIDLLVLRGGWWGQYGQYPMSLLHNRGDGTFEDVTLKAGLDSPHPTQTAAWADYDGDGYLDLFVGHESERAPDGTLLHPSQLFHNNHDGTFTEVGAAMGLADLGFVKGVAWGDFNNTGRPGLYISVKGGRNKLFRNDGPAGKGWRFTDVTAQAGVAQQSNSFATWFFDYDNDGWPDIFSAGYSTESMHDVGAFELGKPFTAETPRLYRNNHDGTFTNVATDLHLDRAILAMGASFGDLDNDGFLDVYLGTGESSYEALLPNRMFRNDRAHGFQDVTTTGGFGHLQKGHGVAFGDVCNTGHEDIFEEMGGAYPGDVYTSTLYRNPGNANASVTLELEGTKANRPAIGARVDATIMEDGKQRHIVRTVGFGSSFGYSSLRQHFGIGKAAEIVTVEVRWPGSNTIQHFQHLAANTTYHLREGDPTAQPLTRKTCKLADATPMQMTSENK